MKLLYYPSRAWLPNWPLMKRRGKQNQVQDKVLCVRIEKWWLAWQWVPGRENWTLAAQRGAWFGPGRHPEIFFPSCVPFFLQTRKKNVQSTDRNIIYIIITTVVVSHVGQKLSQFFTEVPTELDLSNVMLFICSSICSWTKRQTEKHALGLVRKTGWLAALSLFPPPFCLHGGFMMMWPLW